VSTVISINGSRPIVDYMPTPRPPEDGAAAGMLPLDRVSISPEARRRQEQDAQGGNDQQPQGDATAEQGTGQAAGKAANEPLSVGGKPLTADQQRLLETLKARDVHLRAHEAAHQAAGGDLTGPASFSYESGPDGHAYAVGGEVPVAARSGRTPDETIAIAQRVRAAALAPADPSPADLAVAATATQLELRARQQKAAQAAAGANGSRSSGSLVALNAAGMPYTALERLVVRAPEPAEIF
jgi:hypothetical protein